MVDFNTIISTTTLNVNGLKTPIKSQSLSDQEKKEATPNSMLLQLFLKKVKKMKIIFCVKIEKKVEVAVLI